MISDLRDRPYLMIRGGHILAGTEVIHADVLIQGEIIASVGANLTLPPDAQELDATGQIVLPGLVNAHTHAHHNLMKGTGDNWTLEELRNRAPALYGNYTAEELYLSAAVGAIEMLKTGCTAAYDQFAAIPALTDEAVEAVVRAYTDVGLRAVVAPSVSDMTFYRVLPGFLELLPAGLGHTVENIQAAPAENLLRITENAIRRWNGSASGRIRVATGPIIPGDCSDALFSGCMRLAREYGIGLHTHIAETKIQAIQALRRWGRTLVRHLADEGWLGPGFVGGHGVWLTEEDIRQLADAGAMVAHNPASNLKLGSGIAPIREMLDHGLTVGLGTDGSMSSDNQNMFEAMRFAALVSKVRFPHQPERWIGARDVWKMATTESARVLGMADDLGIVAPGHKADLVLLQGKGVFLCPLNDLLNSLVYSETGADVRTVLVGGRFVLRDGRVLTLDEGRLLAQAQEAAERSRARNVAGLKMAEQLTPYIAAACRASVTSAYAVNRYAGPTGEEGCSG